VMQGIETKLKTQSFFVLDENFLMHRKRALRLLELMEKKQKSWSLYVFSSADVSDLNTSLYETTWQNIPEKGVYKIYSELRMWNGETMKSNDVVVTIS